MVSVVVCALLAAQGEPSFAEIERLKYDAYLSHPHFRGTYVMVTLPQQGVGVRQEVVLTLSSSGRRLRVVADSTPLVESGWTARSRWTANLQGRVYTVETPERPIDLSPDYRPLPVEPGAMNVTLNEQGPRFNADPAPRVTERVSDNTDGVPTTKVTAVAENPGSRGRVTITQWFDRGTYIVRRFEIVKTTPEGQSRIVGFLTDADLRSPVPDSAFDLPSEIATQFTRVGSPGSAGLTLGVPSFGS